MELAHDRRGAGEPLVLLHGIGSRWQVFEPVIDGLADDFEVLAVDLPGFGASPRPPGGVPSIAALAGMLADWLAGQGVERPHVAGNSTGGALALELAARGLAASAIALAPIGFWSARERAFCQASVRATRALARGLRPFAPALVRVRPVRAALFAQMSGRPAQVDPRDALESIDALLGATAFDDVWRAFGGYVAPATAADSVPVTIAWGSRDRLLLPRQLERARMLLPRARHVAMRGVGHLMMGDDPEAVADLIRAGARAPAGEPAPTATRSG